MQNIPKRQCFVNRELSWLKFNQRVLDEAGFVDTPLLERLRFVSIYTSNLDEFFMIRVGSLVDQRIIADSVDYCTGMNPDEQLRAIYAEVAAINRQRDVTYNTLRNLLAEEGIIHTSFSLLNDEERDFVDGIFANDIQPLLSPQVIDNRHPFPHIKNKEMYVTVFLDNEDSSTSLGIIPTSYGVPRLFFLPTTDGSLKFLLAEEIVLHYAEQIFFMYRVEEKMLMRLTRNADIDTDLLYDEGGDYAEQMKQILKQRDKLVPVRLELSHSVAPQYLQRLLDKFHLENEQTFINLCPFDYGYVDSIIKMLNAEQRAELLYEPLRPQPSPQIKPGRRVMDTAEKEDILLFYPYESMNPLLNLLKEAATDPRVVSIKICLYRLSNTSSIVEYLCQAAENGKDVTALIELRARFDEENNINWSSKLHDAGVKVIYGLEGFKVHCKLLLITYKHGNQIRYITQIGTGNYNENTAKVYSDLCLITSNKSIAADAGRVFNNLLLSTQQEDSYKSLLVAPTCLRSRLLEEIDKEIAHVAEGGHGRIIMKFNSLTDRVIMEKLIEASCAGVKIDLIVRGICCLCPQVPGYTENIHVISIVGRFLEHARVFVFGSGKRKRMFISSADMMTRNTVRRVELACPIYNHKIMSRISKILSLQLKDNVKARRMRSDGTYVLRYRKDAEPIDSQMHFYHQAYQTAAASAKVMANEKKKKKK